MYRFNRLLYKALRLALGLALAAGTVSVPEARAGEIGLPVLPAPGAMVDLSAAFTPATLQGLSIRPNDPLGFDFFIRRSEGALTGEDKNREYTKLIKYFLASLTVPDKDQWVNLSPYEHDRIIADNFGRTEMGRDLLAQDYVLKQITSSLMYPEKGLGKKFWDEVYARAWQQYRTTDIPVNTFNKVWIVPDEAVVYESGRTVMVLKSHLKVMLEQDYLAANKNRGQPGDMFKTEQPRTCPQAGCQANEALSVKATQGTNRVRSDNASLTSQIIRELIIPQLTKEINEGKNFAQLRQMFSAMILATWYKRALKDSFLAKVYQDQARVKGVDQDPATNEAIYRRYLEAFKKGVYNYIKDEVDPRTQQTIPRKYFAGGWEPLQGAVDADAAMMGTPHVVVLKPGTAADFLRRSGTGIKVPLEQGTIDRAAVSIHAAFDAAMIADEDLPEVLGVNIPDGTIILNTNKERAFVFLNMLLAQIAGVKKDTRVVRLQFGIGYQSNVRRLVQALTKPDSEAAQLLQVDLIDLERRQGYVLRISEKTREDGLRRSGETAVWRLLSQIKAYAGLLREAAMEFDVAGMLRDSPRNTVVNVDELKALIAHVRLAMEKYLKLIKGRPNDGDGVFTVSLQYRFFPYEQNFSKDARFFAMLQQYLLARGAQIDSAYVYDKRTGRSTASFWIAIRHDRAKVLQVLLTELLEKAHIDLEGIKLVLPRKRAAAPLIVTISPVGDRLESVIEQFPFVARDTHALQAIEEYYRMPPRTTEKLLQALRKADTEEVVNAANEIVQFIEGSDKAMNSAMSYEDTHLGPVEQLSTGEMIRARVAAAIFQELMAMRERGEEEQLALLAYAAHKGKNVPVEKFPGEVPRVKFGEVIPGARWQGKNVYDQRFFDERGRLNENVRLVARASLNVYNGEVVFFPPFRRNAFLKQSDFDIFNGISGTLQEQALNRVGRAFFRDLRPVKGLPPDISDEELAVLLKQSQAPQKIGSYISPQRHPSETPEAALMRLIGQGLLPQAALRYLPVKGRSGLATHQEETIRRVVNLVASTYRFNVEQRQSLMIFLQGQIFFEDALPRIFPPADKEFLPANPEAVLTVAWYMARFNLRDKNFDALVGYIAEDLPAQMPVKLRSALLQSMITERFDVRQNRVKEEIARFFFNPRGTGASLPTWLQRAGLNETEATSLATASREQERWERALDFVYAALNQQPLEKVFSGTRQIMKANGISWEKYRQDMVVLLNGVAMEYLSYLKAGNRKDKVAIALARDAVKLAEKIDDQSPQKIGREYLIGWISSDVDAFLKNYLEPAISDHAMAAADMLVSSDDGSGRAETSATAPAPNGGIDFDGRKLDLKIQRDGPGEALPVSAPSLSSFKGVAGFSVGDLAITPAGDLPILNELRQQLQAPTVAMPVHP